MKAFSAVLGGLLLSICGLAACGGNNSGPGLAPVDCVLPTGTQVALAYPISGSSGVSDTLAQVVIAASPALPGTWQVALLLPLGTLYTGNAVATIASNSVPTPFATPSFASPTYQSSALSMGALPAASSITVLLSNQNGGFCNGFSSIGTFTTQ
jgi:hypothetical protein